MTLQGGTSNDRKRIAAKGSGHHDGLGGREAGLQETFNSLRGGDELTNPFINDPFAMVYEAFKNLYPEKDCSCYFDAFDKNEEGDTVYGETLFADDGTMTVGVDVTLNLANAVEIFAHELAHVAVGSDVDHGEEWERAFDAIFQEYNRIGEELFDKHTSVKALNGKTAHK